MILKIEIFGALPLVLFFIQCCNAFRETYTELNPEVNTTLGLIRGALADDGDYYMFMGIPYAQVNASNPFGKSIPQEPFDEVFDAIDDTAVCPQVEEFNNTITGSLDCLHINIYAPTSASSTNLKPVMVYIHGGQFMNGFSGRYVYGPKYLVRHDVVYVTLNYRLGPYGFMCLGTPEIPGNQGLKDQLIALRWINENIEAFGGDPNKITAFGNSAGAMSVDLHIISPHEPLFQQAVIQSGTSFSTTHAEQDRIAPLRIASHLGYVTTNIDEAISFLATLEPNVIISAISDLNIRFRVCVEDQFEGVESFMTKEWMQAAMPKVNEMKILIGFNSHESLPLVNSDAAEIQNFIIPVNLESHFDIDDPDFAGMVELMHHFYIGDEDISYGKVMDVIDFNSDMAFIYPTYRGVAKYLENNAGDIYLYMMSYSGERNFLKQRLNIPKDVGGAIHADEIGYLFDIAYLDTPNAEDQLILDRMTELWTNFAKFGNPTPETSELLPVFWHPIRNDSMYHYLEINSNLTAGTRANHERMSFLDLFFKANAHLLKYDSMNH